MELPYICLGLWYYRYVGTHMLSTYVHRWSTDNLGNLIKLYYVNFNNFYCIQQKIAKAAIILFLNLLLHTSLSMYMFKLRSLNIFISVHLNHHQTSWHIWIDLIFIKFLSHTYAYECSLHVIFMPLVSIFYCSLFCFNVRVTVNGIFLNLTKNVFFI